MQIILDVQTFKKIYIGSRKYMISIVLKSQKNVELTVK